MDADGGQAVYVATTNAGSSGAPKKSTNSGLKRARIAPPIPKTPSSVVAAQEDYRKRAIQRNVTTLQTACISNVPRDKKRAVKVMEELLRFAAEGEQLQTIVDAGAVPLLFGLLRQGGNRGRALAATLLDYLAATDAGRMAGSAPSDVIPLLVTMLRDSNIEVHVSAAGALSRFAEVCELHPTIVKLGAIHLFLALLQSDETRGRFNATRALCSLAANPNLRHPIVEAGSLPPLIVLLTDVSLKCRSRAAVALRNLAADSPEVQKAVAAAGAVPPLVELLQCIDDTTGYAAAAAAATLGQLACTPELHEVLTQAGAVLPLVTLFRGDGEHKTAVSRVAAGHALKRLVLAREDVAHEVATELGLSDTQNLELLHAKLDEISLTAAGTGSTE